MENLIVLDQICAEKTDNIAQLWLLSDEHCSGSWFVVCVGVSLLDGFDWITTIIKTGT